MHAFVYRLVERLTREGPGMSRNRHFATFSSPEGKEALRIARHLRSVAKDIAAAPAPARLERQDDARIKVEIPVVAGVRIAYLDPASWDILRRMPIVRAALGEGAKKDAKEAPKDE